MNFALWQCINAERPFSLLWTKDSRRGNTGFFLENLPENIPVLTLDTVRSKAHSILQFRES